MPSALNRASTSQHRYRLALVRRRRLIVLSVLFLPLLVVGVACSAPGGSVTTATPATVVGTLAAAPTVTVPPQYKNGDPVAGKTIFKNGPCAGCHTLADAGTTGTVGPNLDQLKPPLSLVVERVTMGGAVMPKFKGVLTDKQIADVAAYVVKATGGNPNG
jgi:mono/diheme cytochrome c family protein